MNPIKSLKALYANPCNRQKPVSALCRVIDWKLRKRLGKSWVRTVWDRKVRFYPDSRSSMFFAYYPVMDWHEFRFIEKYLRPSDTAVDIGANIGIYSLWMSRFSDHVYAFEPDPVNAERLREQVKQNGGKIHIEECAVSDVSGRLGLTSGKDMENYITEGDSIKSTRLDEYGLETIHFLKVDVEGAELVVFRGAEQLLVDRRIGVIQLEFGSHEGRFGYSSRDVQELLASHGYLLFDYDSDTNTLIRANSSPHFNLWAIADLDSVQSRLSRESQTVS